MTASRLLPFSLVAFPLVFAACGGEGLTLPPEGEPARIEILEEGNNQSGRVNEVLPVTLKVRVTDSRGEPVPGTDVLFSFAGGPAAGVPTPESATTDGDGQASTTLTLGNVASTHKGTAQVQSAPAVSAEFTVIALPADANGIRIVSGDPQSATVNSALPEPLVVLVTDANDNPIPNVPIQWTAEGGGTVSAESNVTDGNGQASVTRTLGPTAGTQTTRADAGPIAGSPAIFTHTATAGGAAGITKVSGDNQSGAPGTELALPLIVEVRDEQGNPISGRAVAWVVGTGGGSVSAQTTPTDAEGRATTNWTLGPSVGPNSVNAVVSGVGTVTFNATATAGSPSAANSEVSAAPTTITVGGQSTITVVARDASNNPVSGASVSVTSSGTGNTITPASASTGANGVATFTFSSTVAETKTITATAGGVAISDQATITVEKSASTTRIIRDEPDRSTSGETVTVEYTVTGPGATPTGTVTITVSGGSESCSASVAAGQCDIVLVNPGNPRLLTATYSGDERFNGSTDTENHRVDPAPPPPVPSASESDVEVAPNTIPADGTTNSTITVRVRAANGSAMANVAVTASASGTGNTITPLTATTDAAGVATFSFASTVAGEKIITVTAGGVTLNDQPHIQVFALVSTVNITADAPDPSDPGELIHVTFAVAGDGGAVPTGGTVEIFSLLESGVGCSVPATQGFCDFALNTPGIHQLGATYSGDAQFESSSDPDGDAHEVTAPPGT